ncbi:MAG: hypothetical protein AAFZ04_04595 [Pseudomonadota bacterium]
MAQVTHIFTHRIGPLCRNIAVSLIAGVCRWRSFEDVNDRFRARPIASQAMITGGVMAALFGASLVAGYFGWIGLLVFWMAVIILVN